MRCPELEAWDAGYKCGHADVPKLQAEVERYKRLADYFLGCAVRNSDYTMDDLAKNAERVLFGCGD